MVALKYLQHFDGGGCKMTTMSKAVEEVELLQTITSHPNVLAFVSVFFDPGQQAKTVIVTEQCLMDLGSYIHHQRHVEDFYVRKWMQHLCLAVAHIHFLRVLHRDIKPQNCMLHMGDRQGGPLQLKLADFGVAVRVYLPCHIKDEAKYVPLRGGVQTYQYAAAEVL
jgi:serine/threonine protein kinase